MEKRPWVKKYDAGVPENIAFPDVPLFALFDETASQIPAQPCTVFRDHVISYGQMSALINRMAAGLERMGLRKGDRVGLFLPNIPQFVMAYYAILKAGGVVVAINPQYRQRELEFQARDAGVRAIIGLSSAVDLLAAARERAGYQSILLTDVEEAFEMPRWVGAVHKDLHLGKDYRLSEILAPSGMRPSTIVSSEDVAIFQYSGGTTGIPKGAVALHRSLVANSFMFRRWLTGLQDGQETTLLAIPLYHVYGMVVGMSVSVLLGSKMVLVPDPRNLQDLLGNIERYQASFFPGVPTLYALINRDPEVQAGKYQLRSIRACISGSAPLLKEIQDRFEDLTGAALMEGYGLSEAPTATHCNPMLGERRSGSIGLPLPGVDCRIVSLEDGETDVAEGEAGELLIRSPQVMKGYHQQPEETEKALRDGWLYTGDIARMDGDGYFYIVDRKKDLIKVGGLQVWPREIEEVLVLHPKVQEVAVAGVPDLIRGEAPKAWIVLKPGETAAVDELRAWCETSLSQYKVPFEIDFVAALPKSNVGKVLRRELVRMHQEKG